MIAFLLAPVRLADRSLQWAVDAFAFAMMRRFGVGKAFVRYTFMVMGAVFLVGFSTGLRRWLDIPLAGAWVWLAHIQFREGERAERSQMPPRYERELLLPHAKLWWVASAAYALVPPRSWPLFGLYVMMLLTEYLRNTPNQPPPKEERVLKTADASALR